MNRQACGLLLIDMQRDFLEPLGYAAQAGLDLTALREAIPASEQLLGAARRLGLTVIHTREGHRRDLSDVTEVKRRRAEAAGAPIGSVGPLGRFLVRGEYGHDFIDSLTPRDGEVVIDKPGYGAFYATDLDHILRARGITRLFIAGVTTEVCVHSTLREAIDRGFHCTTIADACAASDRVLHQAMLTCIASESGIFGQVATAVAAIKHWEELP